LPPSDDGLHFRGEHQAAAVLRVIEQAAADAIGDDPGLFRLPVVKDQVPLSVQTFEERGTVGDVSGERDPGVVFAFDVHARFL
jgi:hypothetical protein